MYIGDGLPEVLNCVKRRRCRLFRFSDSTASFPFDSTAMDSCASGSLGSFSSAALISLDSAALASFCLNRL
jgi:hypothetical protein